MRDLYVFKRNRSQKKAENDPSGHSSSEMQHCISCSEMDALQWMGAVRTRVQTADKNITIIHKQSHSSPSVNILW